ncbi:MAG TPA: isocitrate lyase/phosphoenolpyruvate mutase family protein, partial [Xanthobacteraceae bacterium]
RAGAPGSKNDGRALSRIDEWPGAARLRQRLRSPDGAPDRGSRIQERVRRQQRHQPGIACIAGPGGRHGVRDLAYDSVIAANVDIPVVADVDDFGATPLNVYRFSKQCDRAGIGCAAFDDRMPINRATAYSVPGVLPKARMIDNIHAAADARTDMVLIARCLAPTPNNSYTEMLDRAAAYAEAGADCVWIGLPTLQDFAKAADLIKKPLFAVIGRPNFPATQAALKTARVAVGQTPPMVNIALGAIDKALAELQATGSMAEAQKGALGRASVDKVEQVEELNARSRKYNLPSGSATER